jgi:hypothetical protein
MTATRHPKIQPGHLRRQAVVYIRQSSAHQVRGNRESAARRLQPASGPWWSGG